MSASVEPSNLSVCFNSNTLEKDEPVELSPTAKLRYSNDTESNALDDYLEKLVASDLFGSSFPLLTNISPKLDGSGSSSTQSSRPRRYVVLESSEAEVQRRHLALQRQLALLRVAPFPLRFGFNFRLYDDGRRHRNYHVEELHSLVKAPLTNTEGGLIEISKANVMQYAALFGVTRNWRDSDWERPMRLLNMYRDICSLPANSQFHYVGLFALLEGILAHKPKPTDPTESIGRQMRRKTSLVMNRSEESPNAATHFSQLPTDKRDELLWSALYDLRSEIAHGNTPTFEKGEGKKQVKLDDLASCVRYVDDVARLLLRQLCAEPQLMSDLREV